MNYNLASVIEREISPMRHDDYFKNVRDKLNIDRAAFIERNLRQALLDDAFFLRYQPQVNMYTGEVVGAEALVRWNLNGNIIHPGEFIPVAEKSGLIVQVGEWVLREACREAKRWQLMGLGGEQGLKIDVNLSVKQLLDGFPDVIQRVLSNTGLETRLLGLEITESIFADRDSMAVLHALKKNGIHLSIDDFGTGYSCLSQLKNLPLNTIKIDRTFVMDLGHEDISSVVVETIINLAHKLKMDTVAEGVETKEQAEILKKMGCAVCQGFLYSKPLPADDFLQFARKYRILSKSN